MEVVLSFGVILFVFVAFVFIWVLFTSNLQTTTTQERRTSQPSSHEPHVVQRSPQIQSPSSPRPYSHVAGGSGRSRRIFTTKKKPALVTEYDGGRGGRTNEPRSQYFISRGAATSEDKQFLAELRTINGLMADKVFVEQAGVPTLDLHCATCEEADHLFVYFLKRHRKRNVRIITGRGLHSATGTPTLRQKVENRLMERGLKFTANCQGGAFDFYNQ